MLGQRRRRWTNIEPTMGECLVFAGGCTGVIHWPIAGMAGPALMTSAQRRASTTAASLFSEPL